MNELKQLDGYTAKINDAITNIKNEYFYIGALLNEINNRHTYLEDGYKNIIEYCESVFGFKKSFTYNLMKVADKFRDPNGTMFTIKPQYRDYDFSKLVIMCNMNAEQLHVCNPEYSVKTLLAIKKGFFSSSNSTRVENKNISECIGKSDFESDAVIISGDDGFVNITLFNTGKSPIEFGLYVCGVIENYCCEGKSYQVRIMVN